MDRKDAIDALRQGHTVWSEEFAAQVCQAIGVKAKKGRVMHSDPPGTFKGLTLKPEFEGTRMVDGLSLAEHVAAELKIELGPFASRISGRGSRAFALADAIEKHLGTMPPGYVDYLKEFPASDPRD